MIGRLDDKQELHYFKHLTDVNIRIMYILVNPVNYFCEISLSREGRIIFEKLLKDYLMLTQTDLILHNLIDFTDRLDERLVLLRES
jgi:hypothetical protein